MTDRHHAITLSVMVGCNTFHILLCSSALQACTANAAFSFNTLYNQTNQSTDANFTIPISNGLGVSCTLHGTYLHCACFCCVVSKDAGRIRVLDQTICCASCWQLCNASLQWFCACRHISSTSNCWTYMHIIIACIAL